MFEENYQRFEDQDTLERPRVSAPSGGYLTQESDTEVDAHARLPPRGRGEAR